MSDENDTEDRIFILSYKEACKYFKDNDARKCLLTDYAAVPHWHEPALWYLSYKKRQPESWWLRSRRTNGNGHAAVYDDGSFCWDHYNNTNIALRPALWLANMPQIRSANSITGRESSPDKGPYENRTPIRKINIESFKTVGNYGTFGVYYHSDSFSSQSPVEWLVLDVQENKALLVSRYVLDSQPYNTEFKKTTWESCTIRTWLNDEFLAKAFSEEERKRILTTQVDNSSLQGYNKYKTPGGNDTQDRIFLLSYAEAWKYFSDDNSRKCAPTDFAISRGSLTSSNNAVDGRAAGRWWLRSPGSNSPYATCILVGGSRSSTYVQNTCIGVRPALWINLEP